MPNSLTLKQKTFAFLHWVFEGETFTLSFGILLYLILWFLPAVEHGNAPGLDETVWHQLGWGPTSITALYIIPLAVLQVVAGRLFPCVWWIRTAISLAILAFLAYTSWAPAWVAYQDTGYLPEYVAGATTIVLSSFLTVARNLRSN